MVKLRLARAGRKKVPVYRIVAADSRMRRDGRFLEVLGQYAPKSQPATVTLKESRIMYWLKVGAQPTETVRSILSRKGVLLKWHLEKKGRDAATTEEELAKHAAAQTLKGPREAQRKARRRAKKAAAPAA
jgi:small subunit ribosomal protein S16